MINTIFMCVTHFPLFASKAQSTLPLGVPLVPLFRQKKLCNMLSNFFHQNDGHQNINQTGSDGVHCAPSVSISKRFSVDLAVWTQPKYNYHVLMVMDDNIAINSTVMHVFGTPGDDGYFGGSARGCFAVVVTVVRTPFSPSPQGNAQ